MANTVWGATVNTTLSGGNLVATATGVGGVLSQDVQTAGMFYFEITIGATFASANSGIGICNGNAALATVGATPSNAVLLRRNGTLFIDNVSSGSVAPTLTAGNVVGVAVNLISRMIWFRVGAGNWNNNAANDPVGSIGGKSIAPVIPGYQSAYVVGALAQTGDTVTANFGTTAFVGTVPSGYVAGWPTGATSLPTSMVATGSGGAVWTSGSGSIPVLVSVVGAGSWVSLSSSTTRIGMVGVGSWINASSIQLNGVSATAKAGKLGPRYIKLTGASITGKVSAFNPGPIPCPPDWWLTYIYCAAGDLQVVGADVKPGPPREAILVSLYPISMPDHVYGLYSDEGVELGDTFSKITMAVWCCESIDIVGNNRVNPDFSISLTPAQVVMWFNDVNGQPVFTGTFNNPGAAPFKYHIAFSLDTLAGVYSFCGNGIPWQVVDATFHQLAEIGNQEP